MGMYKYLTKIWRQPTKEIKDLRRKRMIEWRKEPTITKVEKPTRIDKARRLGYKSKQGFIVVRVKVKKGGRQKARPNKGRRPKRMGAKKYTASKSHRGIAEERAAKRYSNLEVLNSYYVGDDSVHTWYEVILVDPVHTAIAKDKDVGWITDNKHRGRAHRGKTSAGRKSRGLIK